MSIRTPVPSDVDATSLLDLAQDCREVSTALAGRVIDLNVRAARTPLARLPLDRLPLDRLPLDRLPFSFGVMPVEITEDLLVTVSGMDDY